MNKLQIEELEVQILQDPTVQTILDRLSKELPKEYSYHGVQHTREVLHDAVTLAAGDNLSERKIYLIGIAAAFHDAGFLIQANKNEPLAADIAAEQMRIAGGFSDEEIQLVHIAICDTEFDVENNTLAHPSNSFSSYLLDADVSNLGKENFFEKSQLIATELRVTQDKEFLEGQRRLLETHRWYTAAAQRLYQDQKEKNLKKVIELIVDER